MPLFTMKKEVKPLLNINQDKLLSKEENAVKTQYNENFAYCNAINDLFYYIAVRKDKVRMIDRSYPTKSNDIDTLILYAIKQSLIALDLLCHEKEVIIYSRYSLEEIIEFSKIDNTGNMKRYQSLRILEQFTNFKKVIFKKEKCPYPNILDLANKMEMLKNDKD